MNAYIYSSSRVNFNGNPFSRASSETCAILVSASLKGVGHYSTGLFLAIAYSASIGGIATLVGTPTNLVFPRILTLMYPEAPEISFANWFFFALPVTVLMLVAILGVIYMIYRPREPWAALDKNHFRIKYKELGPTGFEERTVLIVFLALAFMWIFRGCVWMRKWSSGYLFILKAVRSE